MSHEENEDFARDQRAEIQRGSAGTQTELKQGGNPEHHREPLRRSAQPDEVNNMAQVLDVQELGGGAGMGGIGGGLLGGILAAALFGNGFNRNHGDRDCVDNATLSAALAGVTDSQMNTAVLQSLGQIQAAIPLAEAQVQLALAGSTGEVRSHLGQVENAVLAGQAVINKNVSDAIAASLASQNNINLNVLQTASQTLMTIKDDGEKTRALITSNQIAELNRIAAERQDEIIELRNGAARDRDRHGIEINMINNQNQNQLQFQQQAQVLAQLGSILGEVGQLARATNQNLIVGNTGAVATGPQTANPVNVRA